MPSVHSRDLCLKLSCENMISVVGKAGIASVFETCVCYRLRGTLLVCNREIWAERPQGYFHTLDLTVCHKGRKLLYGEVELFTTVLNSVPWLKTLVQNYIWLVEPLLSVYCCRYLPVPQLI